MMRSAVAVAVALVAAVAGAAAAAAAASGSPGAGTCARRDAPPFLDAVGLRSPYIRIEPSPPLEVGLLPSSTASSAQLASRHEPRRSCRNLGN
jgi:hypothetical protein